MLKTCTANANGNITKDANVNLISISIARVAYTDTNSISICTAPDKAPIRLRGYHGNQNTVHLQWEAVPNDGINGVFRGYTLKYRWKEIMKGWSATNTVKTYFDVRAVPGAMSIEFKVAAKTTIGSGPYSTIAEVEMQYTCM